MVGLSDVVIVTLIAIGAVVLVGILGYVIDKQEGNQEGSNDK